MKLTELFTVTGEPFSYYPGLVHQFDISVNATVFLCFIAWRTFPDELDGWKALSIDIVKEATGLSVKEQSTARKQLVKAGLILERYARLEHKLKFKLLPAEIAVSPNAEREDAQTPKGNIGTPLNGVSTKELKGDKKERDSQKPTPVTPEAPIASNCPTRKFSDGWCDAYQAQFGAKYDYNSRDGKAAARLVQLDTPESLVEIVKKAWKQTDDKKFWACMNRSATTWDFLASLSKIRMELARAKAFQNHPIEFHYGRNQNH